MYYRGSLGALLIFDLTNSSSFEHLAQWIDEVRANVKSEIPLLLVGNKSDLADERLVSIEEINNFTKNFNLYYMETSAKTGEGVGDCFYILACLMIGSGVPDQLISKGIIYSPGQILAVPSKAVTSPATISEPEYDYSAPPVPEPTPTFEPEAEFEFEAPPVPEPSPMEKSKSIHIFEPESEPDILIPEPKIEEKGKKKVEFEFKTPDEILSESTEQKSIITSTSDIPSITDKETYKPKAVPFTSSVPIPAPPPEGFQTPQNMQPVETTKTSAPFLITKKEEKSKTEVTPLDKPVEPISEPSSESLVDYMPETILSKKEKKKLAKKKKKEEKARAKLEKEKKIQEAREKQENLIKDMKKTKKEKKVKKEQVEEEIQPAPSPPKTSETPSLFQALTQKVEESEKIKPAEFIPFAATKKSDVQQSSKLRIIPNVADIESTTPATRAIPINQKKEQQPASKEIIICKQCGAILSSDYAFCNKCGTKL